jgi:hypothetical protein
MDDDGVTWISPSDVRFNGLPLAYCTPGYTYSVVGASKHITLKNNVLSNGTLISGNYVQKITNVDGTTYTVALISPTPDLDTIGVYIRGTSGFDSTNFAIPLTYNGEINYLTYTPMTLNATYKFNVKSNWIDEIDLSSGYRGRVFGFARGDYKVRLSLKSGECKLIGINVLK